MKETAYILLAWFFTVSASSLYAGKAEFSERYKMQFAVQGSVSTLKMGKAEYSSQAVRPVFTYFSRRNIGVEVGYYSMTSPEDGSTLLNGFDIGGKIFLFSPGAEYLYSNNTTIINSWTHWTH